MKEVKSPRKPLIYYYLIALVILMLLNVFLFPSMLERQVYEVPYSQFLDMVDDGRVTQVALDETNREIVFLATDESGSEAVYQTGIWPDDGRRKQPSIKPARWTTRRSRSVCIHRVRYLQRI